MYGAVGAVIAPAVVQILPFALELTHGNAHLQLSVGRVVGALTVLAIFVVGGGVVAILLGDATQPKQAIAYGLGWQATIGGFFQGTRVAASGATH